MARLAGVSKKTVSRVINRSALLSEDTRTKVEAVIQQLGYVPNPQARALALRRNFLLGLLHDNPNAQTVLKVQEGVLDAIRDTEFALVCDPSIAIRPHCSTMPTTWSPRTTVRCWRRRSITWSSSDTAGSR